MREGRRVAEQMRQYITINRPVPLMQIRVAPPSSDQRNGPSADIRNTDAAIQSRLEVLRTVESRLCSIRREVDEGQRALLVTERATRQSREREVASTAVTTSTVTAAEAKPLSPYRQADLRDEDDDDSSEAGDIEQWMSARRLQPERPDEERYEFRPNVVEELYAAEEEAREQRRLQLSRFGRAFSEGHN